MLNTQTRTVGDHLREWRQRRRMSQLDLAGDAGISTRHLSFVETGRAAPSRDMVLTLAERLDVPLRARNALLVAAGYAPVFKERKLDDPDMAAIKRAVDIVLKGHAPNPALAIDRRWTILAANDPVHALLAGVAPDLLKAPANALRVSLHPAGLAPRIVNLAQWRRHVFERVARQIDVAADPALIDLLEELRAYPAPPSMQTVSSAAARLVTPLQLRTDAGVLSLFTSTTIFGMPQDVTLEELAIETFFPADRESAKLVAGLRPRLG